MLEQYNMKDERRLISELVSKKAAAIEAVRDGILMDSIGKKLYHKGGNFELYNTMKFGFSALF